VIGVSIRKDIDHAQVAIVSEKNHDVAAFGGPYQVTSLNNRTKVVYGTSFATAQVYWHGRTNAPHKTFAHHETSIWVLKKICN
jgi:purine nucleoside permease